PLATEADIHRDRPTLRLSSSAYRGIGWKQVRRFKTGLGCADVMKLVVGKQRRRVAYRAVGAPKEPFRATLLHWRQCRIVAGQPAIEGRVTRHDSALI